jgi:hypothetical protein
MKTIVAFLSGQSNPGNSALSPEQAGFLERAGVSVAERLMVNFPYPSEVHVYTRTPLLRACVNNASQYLASRRPDFAIRHREDVERRLMGYERVILLSGSCGLELLVNLQLSPQLMDRLYVFAYGPVSRRLPQCALLWRIQGKQDFISKWWHREAEYFVPCHHMNYLSTPGTVDLFRRFHTIATQP